MSLCGISRYLGVDVIFRSILEICFVRIYGFLGLGCFDLHILGLLGISWCLFVEFRGILG